jgi:Aspartyl protease
MNKQGEKLAGISPAKWRVMRSRLVLVIAILLGALFVPFQTRAAERLDASSPFEYREGLLWLKVGVRGSARPLNLLLDSGANVSVIHLPTARKLKLKLGQPVQVDGVDATTTGYWPEHLPAATGPAALPADFLAVDLSELSRGSACTVDGLLGADFFAEHTVRIDFAAHKIFIDSASPTTGRLAEIPLRHNAGSLQVQVGVAGGAPQWVRLDTGCNNALHWVTPNPPASASTPQMAVALTRMSIPVTRMNVALGPFHFDDVPAAIHRSEIFAGEAGLLGNGLLDRFQSVTIDVRSQRVLLETAGR